MDSPCVVLGSASKFRLRCLKEWLQALGSRTDDQGIRLNSLLSNAKVLQYAPDIAEHLIVPSDTAFLSERGQCPPELLTVEIAKAKAKALIDRSRQLEPPLPAGSQAWLITADQVVHYEGRIREKPVSLGQGRDYLKSYDLSHPAITCSALVVTHLRTGQQVHGVDVAKQYFHPIPDALIDELLAEGTIMHCAGGFMVDDDRMKPYLARREGTEDSIVGFPLHLLERLLLETMALSR